MVTLIINKITDLLIILAWVWAFKILSWMAPVAFTHLMFAFERLYQHQLGMLQGYYWSYDINM